MNFVWDKLRVGRQQKGVSKESLKELCRSLLIESRKRGDDERASELSQAYEVLKRYTKKQNCCVDCGSAIHYSAIRCAVHERSRRYRGRAIC